MSDYDQLPVLEVPRIDQFPGHFDVVEFADYLLSMLFRHKAGLLHADFREDGGRWSVKGWTAGGPVTSEDVVAVSENKGVFRAVLARFGFHYMGGQLYGGFAERVCTQEGKGHVIAIYMANDQWRGYWLRVYAR